MNLLTLSMIGFVAAGGGHVAQIDPESRMFAFQGTWGQTFRVVDNPGIQIRRTMRVDQLDVTIITELIGVTIQVTPRVVDQIGEMARDLRRSRRLEHTGTAQVDRNRNMLVSMRWLRLANGDRTRKTTSLTFALSNSNQRVSLVGRSTRDYDPDTMTLNKQGGAGSPPPTGEIDPENRIAAFQGTWEGTYAVTGGSGSIRRVLVVEGLSATFTTEWLGRNDPPSTTQFRRTYGSIAEFLQEDDRVVHTGTAQIDRDGNMLANLTNLRVAGRVLPRKTDLTFALLRSGKLRLAKSSDDSYGMGGIVLRKR